MQLSNEWKGEKIHDSGGREGRKKGSENKHEKMRFPLTENTFYKD